ncbi:hypothetical protein CEXT_172711 [Caerostris extrusa]|uniref:Uncharacterized protein n=1 Tax=Caerostris extrusa TaxID=172846 RepID=A0AAV4W5F3_CAEEX|nr:hypothetical protein CEXT_172711 [Caerostris extrusa]
MKAVAEFRLVTDHDGPARHLHNINVLEDHCYRRRTSYILPSVFQYPFPTILEKTISLHQYLSPSISGSIAVRFRLKTRDKKKAALINGSEILFSLGDEAEFFFPLSHGDGELKLNLLSSLTRRRGQKKIYLSLSPTLKQGNPETIKIFPILALHRKRGDASIRLGWRKKDT